MNDKVEIEITEGYYAKSHRNGAFHRSVGYSGRRYGALSPCNNDEEVRRSIKYAEERIKKEGDIPIINWGKVKPVSTEDNLVGWCK